MERNRITRDNLHIYLPKYYNDLNMDNAQFVEEMKSYLEEGKEYSTKQIYSIFNPILRYEKPTTQPQYNIGYWCQRGYSREEAINKIRSIVKTIIIFTRDELYDYIIRENPYSFNTENTEFVRNIVNQIQFTNDDHITGDVLYRQVIKLCTPKELWGKDKGYLTHSIQFYTHRGYSEQEAQKIIHEIGRQNSLFCEEYYTTRGIDNDTAKERISIIQRNISHKSKATKDYWINLGLSEEDSIQKAKQYASQKSVWGKKYWMNKGLSEDEAIKKTYEYNSSCFECKCYNNDTRKYIEHLEKLSQHQRKNWQHIGEETILKMGCIVHKSKSEKKCFKLIKDLIDDTIQNETYLVMFPEGFQSSNRNQYFYACDGYIPYKGNVIIVEFDGSFYHNQEFDKIRDEEILFIDDKVLGILRISETLFNNKDIKYVINKIENGIQSIKDCKEERVVITD